VGKSAGPQSRKWRMQGVLTVSLYQGMESTFWRHVWWNAGYFGCIYYAKSLLPKPKVSPSSFFRRTCVRSQLRAAELLEEGKGMGQRVIDGGRQRAIEREKERKREAKRMMAEANDPRPRRRKSQTTLSPVPQVDSPVQHSTPLVRCFLLPSSHTILNERGLMISRRGQDPSPTQGFWRMVSSTPLALHPSR